MLLQTRRGASRNGGIINAKPIFVLALIEVIRRGEASSNKFYYNSSLQDTYVQLYEHYNPGLKVAPLFQPFYYLVSDGYWHIQWVKQPSPDARPSTRMFREDASYGYLDNTLWDLLQEEDTRRYYEAQIISYFQLNTTIDNNQ